MKDAVAGPDGAKIRWVEIAGDEPVRVCVHGAGAQAAAYFTHAMTLPSVARRRTLMMDLLGFGLSDRPTGFGYGLEDHADALARALDAAGVGAAEVIGHSMGGAVAIVLAVRRPDLVSRLVLIEAPLDPVPPPAPGTTGITSFTEAEFAEGGMAQILERVGPFWAATMRLADPVALHRSAYGLRAGTSPSARKLLMELTIPRTFLVGSLSQPLEGRTELEAAGVQVVTVPDAGHNVMVDNPQGFALSLDDSPTPGTPERSS
ncbi:alpha/beta fold hydrolase [Actinomadura rupiterrae]|uniref:alpha/beta fold hydrolase n=1 Tax=Actinomadura rupiterrae TaxID=559627 RepID=UPI0020A5FB7F|nr:alpha/beta hydrolase [Actinomadura rupiterrae]MCP2342158.1 pimeloyl-ACP methyl ester carboxylesterase [Actinomadura rupiterrae]